MSSPYRIVEVTDRKTLTDFIHAPRAAQGADPNWVPPLDLMKREDFSPGHPYFQHAEWQPFVAYEGNRPVGRISAQIDRLYHEYHDPCTGFFGLIEGIDDPVLFRALTEVAEYWLRDRGMTRILGPFNLGINQEVGLLVDGFDTPPYFLMGHAQPYYSRRLEALGYRGCQDMLAYLAPPHFELPRLFARQLRRVEKEAVIRPLDRSRKKEELEAVRDIFNDAWSENWGFVPFTREEFSSIGHEMLLLIPDDFIQIAELDGKPAAFIVLLPNLNEAIADLNGRLLPLGWARLLWRLKVRFPESGRVPLMGVRRAYHNTRYGPGLAFSVIDAVRHPAMREGMREVELSWILEDNMGMRNIIESIGGHVSKRYRMYQKALG
jgi:hypothetical protein